MLLDFEKTQKLLSDYNLSFSNSKIVKNKKELLSSSFKYPLVLKITDKLHKTDIKGVVLDINNEKELLRAYSRLSRISKKLVLQEMVEGQQIIMGAKIDCVFGPILLFGLGGIFVEVTKDLSFRLAPVDKKEVQKMIQEIKAYPILKGVRGKKGVKINDLEKMLLNLSDVIVKENFKEIDLNPVIANSKQTVIVDAKILK